MSIRLKATATATVKPPGRLATTARRKARAATPYAAGLVVALIATMVLRSQLPIGIGIGVVVTLAVTRLLEARDTRRNGGRRAARQRRKWQGTASWRDKRKHLSAAAARRKARFTRPQTRGRLAPHEAGVHVGTAGRQRLYITHEDSALLLGIRAGKSAYFSDAITDAVGSVAAFSVFPDLYTHTAVRRAARSRKPLLVLNPRGDGNIPTNFAWSPLDGCETADGAISAAGYLVAAAPQDKERDAFWMQQAHALLRLLMHAAILGGYDILDVRKWVMDFHLAAEHALTVLDNHPMAVEGWGDELAEILLKDDGSDAQNSVKSTAKSALDWLTDPAMKAVACAPPDQWFDAEAFIEDGTGTLYVVGGANPHNPLTAYLGCLSGHLFETAIRLGSASPGNRLDPPFMLACDELALMKPPLHNWSSRAGGRGVTLLAGTQSPSQMEACWGKADGDTVFDNMSVVVFGGLKVAENLGKISEACGKHDAYRVVKDPVTGKKRREPDGERLTFPPERIRALPEGEALFLHRGVRPLVMRVPRVWDRKGYTPAPAPSPVTAPFVPLEGTAIPGHLTHAALPQRGP